MKNILIISSSPRKKGNSQILCEQFKKGAEAKGHQVKIVRIMEQNIGFCRACDGCMRNGGTCVLKDDMAEILKMFQKADVLVLATPVYFYGISAQMKTFIDRTYPIWQHLGKKEVYYIISAGLGEDIIERSREFDSCIIKIVRAGRIKPVLFLSSFSLYYLVIFSDM